MSVGTQVEPGEPDAAGAPEARLSDRYLTVLGILDAVDRFHREVALTNEVRTLFDGTRLMVSTLYVGIGQAYFVNEAGDVAGVGRATESGWEWSPANEAAEAITRAVAIRKDQESAAFVPLPVQVD